MNKNEFNDSVEEELEKIVDDLAEQIELLEMKSRQETSDQLAALTQNVTQQACTSVRDWRIVELYDENNANKVVGNILWGIVVEDGTGRWNENDYVCSSLLQSYNEELEEIETINGSKYVLRESRNCSVMLPLSSIKLLKKGLSPSEVKKLLTGEDERRI